MPKSSDRDIAYAKWQAMKKRCYDEEEQRRFPSYVGCTVCEEWHTFKNFFQWYKENKINFERSCLDKDLLVKGNKVYGPTTCCIVPPAINGLLVLRKRGRGLLPIGVTAHRGKYNAQISTKGKQQTIGVYKSPIAAFTAYKKAKEKEAKRLAEEYKDIISSKVYKALMNLVMEIGD